MATEIVHHDDVARPQHTNELLFDIGAEALAVDRPIEHARRSESVTAERAQEGQRSPVAVRRKAAQPLALGAPAAQRGHVGLDPGLVDEHQPAWIEAIL